MWYTRKVEHVQRESGEGSRQRVSILLFFRDWHLFSRRTRRCIDPWMNYTRLSQAFFASTEILLLSPTNSGFVRQVSINSCLPLYLRLNAVNTQEVLTPYV